IVRYYPDHNGWNLSILYFSNSFGAALGVLINGFVFIPNFGLPGALLTGGVINVLVALGVYLAVKNEQEETQPATRSKPISASVTFNLNRLSLRGAMLIVAMFTGTASFMYEIAWIRMLSLVFGSSTYSFEVMLSAFILGIALGGFWIRKRIDTFENPIAVLGRIQLVMGTLAALSLVLYMACFDLMVWTRSALSLTNEGYFLFMLINYGSSALVMLPVTICAGMTLPLITKILIEHENSTTSIGHVYASNTLGSIVGVVLASQIVLPLLGLKTLILSGALIDLALGCLLIYSTMGALRRFSFNTVPALGVWLIIAALFSLDQLTMASGPFRSGRLFDESSSEVIYYRDGKSSTVSVVQHDNGIRAIANNGKPDAGLYVPDANGEMPPSANDEHTMMLLPIIGLAHYPQAKSVANIGFGSGLTAHTILGADVDRVDSIEIEPAVIEGARFFESRVERAYTDPRSNIIIGDAKTVLVSNGELYDLIIAEPSNPWVSGVANLFTDQYYGLTRRYLTDNGIFLQWLQLYEIEERLVASIYKALRNNFDQVIFYQVSLTDTVLVASNSGNLNVPLNFEQFDNSGLESELA
ncbi:MAG: spermidine synthase, partial [Gammaproteobacteria bacterium]